MPSPVSRGRAGWGLHQIFDQIHRQHRRADDARPGMHAQHKISSFLTLSFSFKICASDSALPARRPCRTVAQTGALLYISTRWLAMFARLCGMVRFLATVLYLPSARSTRMTSLIFNTEPARAWTRPMRPHGFQPVVELVWRQVSRVDFPFSGNWIKRGTWVISSASSSSAGMSAAQSVTIFIMFLFLGIS